MRSAKGESKAIIGLNDARVLLAMLKGYLAYVYGAVPSSHERDAQIRMIQGVRGRLKERPRMSAQYLACQIFRMAHQVQVGRNGDSSPFSSLPAVTPWR